MCGDFGGYVLDPADDAPGGLVDAYGYVWIRFAASTWIIMECMCGQNDQ